jgi:subfamily B ATP-binding cassette protein MsbA
MDLGTFVVFIIALFKLYDPVRKFAFFYNSFQQAMGASFRSSTFSILKTMCERRRAPTRSRPFTTRSL